MIKKIKICVMALIITTLVACQKNLDVINISPPHVENLIVDINFDEGKGFEITEKMSNLDSKIPYVFEHATFKGAESLRWLKNSAVSGYALAFDGYSNKVKFEGPLITQKTEEFTVSIFIAPRMFEWSWPGDQSNLQVIVGQYDKNNQEGFLLGMHKYGNYSFQIGLGDQWVEIWNEWNPLERYQWNHITATYNGQTGRIALYKNGELVNYHDNIYGEIKHSNTSFRIGSSSTPEMSGIFELNMFNGAMDELKIFDKSYDELDVQMYHNSYKINGKINQISFKDAWLDRSILEDDIYRPIYHANPPQHWMNEPHSLFYFNGYWHLFYQFNLTGPYWRQIIWGHWVSEDMIHWQDVEEAIILDPETPIKDGAWSGGVTYMEDGTPVLFITAGDDAKTQGLYSNQNLVLAKPKDINDPFLREWVVEENLSIIQTPEMGKANEFRDFNVFVEDGVYYMLATGAKHNGQGMAHIFSTTDDSFKNFEYHGSLFEPKIYPDYFGTSWELVNLAKIYNTSKTLSKYIFVLSPAGYRSDNDVYYYLGEFDKETMKFIPDYDEPMKMDLGENVFTGPTIFTDTHNDRVLISSIIQDQRSEMDHYLAGWAHNAGMPRELWLNDDGELVVRPIKELTNYIGQELFEIENRSMDDANELLRHLSIDDQTLYLKFSLENISAKEFGFKFKIDELEQFTSVYYQDDNKRIFVDSRFSGNTQVKRLIDNSFDRIENVMEVEMIIDHSMVEIYINGKTITASIYNTGTGFEFISDGRINIKHLNMYQFGRR